MLLRLLLQLREVLGKLKQRKITLNNTIESNNSNLHPNSPVTTWFAHILKTFFFICKKNNQQLVLVNKKENYPNAVSLSEFCPKRLCPNEFFTTSATPHQVNINMLPDSLFKYVSNVFSAIHSSNMNWRS